MLKTKTIRTGKATLLVVELPNSKYVRCHKGYIVQSCSTELDLLNKCKRIGNGDTNGFIHIGNWQLLGRLPDITEEQASEVVEEYTYNTGEIDGYYDYENDTQTDCPIESLNSLMYTNEVYFENPMGKLHPVHPAYTGEGITAKEWVDRCKEWVDRCKKWQEAQSKVWNKERTFLFIKVD